VRSLISLLITFFLGCGPTHDLRRTEEGSPSLLPSVSPFPVLKETIDAFLPDSLFPPASVGIKIVSLTRGETLYELNPLHLFTPASNQKLLTSAAALAMLGPEHEFVTEVFVDSLLESRIVVRGGGDPLMATADIDSIARFLAPILSRSRQWNLFADISCFDSLVWGKGWMWDDEPNADAMHISPLSVNGNCIGLRFTSGSMPGEGVTVEMIPKTTFATIDNQAVTVPKSADDSLMIQRTWNGTNRIAIGGTLALNDTIEEQVSIRNPDAYFLTLLAERLRSYGISASVEGRNAVEQGRTAALRFSRNLAAVAAFMNKESDNLSAENVLRILGSVRHGSPGTAEKGLHVVREFLSSKGIDTSRVVLVDGSGVSRYNLISPEVITQLLAALYADRNSFSTFYNSLAVAGRDGTLEKRMRGSAAAGVIHAKTGSLAGVSSVSGYAETADGEMLAFSIMMQNFPAGHRHYREVQDRIMLCISAIIRGR